MSPWGIAPKRQTRKPSLFRRVSVGCGSSKRMVVQSPYESTVLVCNIRLRKVKFIVFITPICAKDSKTMGFGGVLWVLSFAEERKYHALGTPPPFPRVRMTLSAHGYHGFSHQ